MATATETADNPVLISLSMFPEVLAAHGVPCPSERTVKRWIYEGVSGIKLRTQVIVGRRYTTIEWFNQFNAQVASTRDYRNSKKAFTGW